MPEVRNVGYSKKYLSQFFIEMTIVINMPHPFKRDFFSFFVLFCRKNFFWGVFDRFNLIFKSIIMIKNHRHFYLKKINLFQIYSTNPKYIAILFYSWQKSHCFLGNREEGIENREEF